MHENHQISSSIGIVSRQKQTYKITNSVIWSNLSMELVCVYNADELFSLSLLIR